MLRVSFRTSYAANDMIRTSELVFTLVMHNNRNNNISTLLPMLSISNVVAPLDINEGFISVLENTNKTWSGK